MKVLVIGSGGREHALAWRLRQSPSVKEVHIAPGNAGTASVGQQHTAARLEDWLHVAKAHSIDLTVVGPEAPLVGGVVDQFRAAGFPVIGPSAEAAQLEGSKAFSKDFMVRAGVPTARYRTAEDSIAATRLMDEFGFPVVLKADGLAAGKGVVIAHDRMEAEHALRHLPQGKIVLEEFLQGEEVSFIVLSDGKRFVPLAPTQDHKAVYDGDQGPNTGGMGACRDDGILESAETDEVIRSIIEPTLVTMAAEGRPFTGFLYAGLMMTANGPRVLEYNVRLGDPETQPLMHGLRSDLAEVLLAAAQGALPERATLEWGEGASVCVVLAAEGYPGTPRTGDQIQGIEAAETTGATVFHAGTKSSGSGVVTAGGRVLGVTASEASLRGAIDSAYDAVGRIKFRGMHYRRDIGAKGLRAIS